MYLKMFQHKSHGAWIDALTARDEAIARWEIYNPTDARRVNVEAQIPLRDYPDYLKEMTANVSRTGQTMRHYAGMRTRTTRSEAA